MQEKLHEILSSATDFMTVEEIADKGKWRSHGNVAVALHNMAKTPGTIVSRKSKTKKLLNDRKAEEFALCEKDFAKKFIEKRNKEMSERGTSDVSDINVGDMPQAVDPEPPVIRKTRTTEPKMPTDKECCNAAKVVATTAGAEIDALHARILTLTMERDAAVDAEKLWETTMMRLVSEDGIGDVEKAITALKNNATTLRDDVSSEAMRAESAEMANSTWINLAAEFECKSAPELRVFINSLIKRTEQLKASAAANETQVVDVKDADYYAVHRIRRGLQRYKKLETAKVEAEVGARVDGQAELYAMVLIDVAKTGAIWNGRKAA